MLRSNPSAQGQFAPTAEVGSRKPPHLAPQTEQSKMTALLSPPLHPFLSPPHTGSGLISNMLYDTNSDEQKNKNFRPLPPKERGKFRVQSATPLLAGTAAASATWVAECRVISHAICAAIGKRREQRAGGAATACKSAVLWGGRSSKTTSISNLSHAVFPR